MLNTFSKYFLQIVLMLIAPLKFSERSGKFLFYEFILPLSIEGLEYINFYAGNYLQLFDLI